MIKEQTSKKDHILEVAEELFSEHGFEGTTTRMIAGKAKVNIAMLSYYFGGKEQLFQALVTKKLENTLLVLNTLREKKVTSWEKIEHLIDLYVDKIFINRKFGCIMHREVSLNQRHELTSFIADGFYRNMTIISGLIIEGQEHGDFRKNVDVPLCMATLFGTISQLAYSPLLCCRLLDEDASPENVFSEKNKDRLKKHLKKLLKSYLVK